MTFNIGTAIEKATGAWSGGGGGFGGGGSGGSWPTSKQVPVGPVNKNGQPGPWSPSNTSNNPKPIGSDKKTKKNNTKTGTPPVSKATNTNPVEPNHSNNLGMAAKSANAADINNSPAKVISRAQADNVALGVYRYPLPNSDVDDQAPYMKIEGFKYAYDENDALGNKNASGQRTVTVYLPLPNNMPVGISQTFEDYSNVFGKIVRATDGMDVDLGSFAQSIMNKFDDADGRLMSDSSKVWALSTGAGTLAGDGFLNSIGTGLGEAMSYFRVNAGVTINPMSQSSYIGTDKREHSFNYKMIPRNQKEAIECKKIIEALQWHSTGERNKFLGGLLINFPSVWNVSFYTADGKPINGMLQIPDAFLTEVAVIYSPDTAGEGFRYTVDNDAFAYSLSLKFVEAQNMTRDDLPYIHQGERLLADIHPITKDSDFTLSADDFVARSSVSDLNDANNPEDVPNDGDKPKEEKPKTDEEKKVDAMNDAILELRKKGYPAKTVVKDREVTYPAKTDGILAGMPPQKLKKDIDLNKDTYSAVLWNALSTDEQLTVVRNAATTNKRLIISSYGTTKPIVPAKTAQIARGYGFKIVIKDDGTTSYL